MPGQSEWAETGQPAPLAPHIYKPLGRPPKQRKRASDEPRNPYKASRLNNLSDVGNAKRKGITQEGARLASLGRHHGRGDRDLKEKKL